MTILTAALFKIALKVKTMNSVRSVFSVSHGPGKGD